MNRYEVNVYFRSDGAKPYFDWLSKLKDKKAAAIIARRVAHQIPKGLLGDMKSIQGYQGIFEFRFDTGPGYRVYCRNTQRTDYYLTVWWCQRHTAARYQKGKGVLG